MTNQPSSLRNYEDLGILREWEVDMMTNLHFHRSMVIYHAESLCREYPERSYLIDTLASSLNHDASKIDGPEYVGYLMKIYNENPPEWYNVEAEFQLAKKAHVSSNPHHPEFWSSPNNMPDTYIAEMCCDWAAMAFQNENLAHAWALEYAVSRWGFEGEKLELIYEYTIYTDSIQESLIWEA